MAKLISILAILITCFANCCSSGLVLHGVVGRRPSSSSSIANQTIESMTMQICSDVQDQTTCLLNIQSRLKHPPTPRDGRHRQTNESAVLTAAMEVSVNEALRAMGTLPRATSLSAGPGSAREHIAVQDCRELLDFTVTELAWAMAEMRKAPSSPSSSLGAWLSAALSNQDTCLEGFEGANRHLENFIRGSLTQVTQLVSNVLTLYTQIHGVGDKSRVRIGEARSSFEFPEWMEERDKELVGGTAREGMKVDAVVAMDGSGQYRSIAEAVEKAPSYSRRRYVIHVKKGVYYENVDMKKKKTNIMLVGDGIGATVISGSRNFLEGWTTFRTPTFAVSGRGFIARDITFRNTAGPEKHQAVALRVDSDQSAFYRCSMEGYQDTLYAHSLRQFYRECHVYGTVDFLFGNGAAVFQGCHLYPRDPLPLQKITLAAQGRKSPHQSTGFTVQDSFVYSTRASIYLGRPWKQFSRVVYLNTFLGSSVHPRGWLEWLGDFGLSTCYFAEFHNYGPGARVAGRVKWPGFHLLQDASQAAFFTAARFLDAMSWLPATGVKFSAGLTH
ncbi:hypothetical protein V2J09_022575 [Rumex salicifolius]